MHKYTYNYYLQSKTWFCGFWVHIPAPLYTASMNICALVAKICLNLPYKTTTEKKSSLNPLMCSCYIKNCTATDHYTAIWWLIHWQLMDRACRLLHLGQKEGPRQAAAPPSPLLAVSNVIAPPSMASVPTSYHLMWHYNYLCTTKG